MADSHPMHSAESKDQGIHQALPLDKPVTVEFTPRKSGQIRYACDMDMISGVIVVE